VDEEDEIRFKPPFIGAWIVIQGWLIKTIEAIQK
jgi:hypothetical protein